MNLSVVLLAAGLSRRMGRDNKLLLPFEGTPLVRHCANVLAACQPREMVVVLGHEADRVQAALEPLSLSCVVNASYAQGQQGSVRVGLDALSRDSAGVLVCLADQPWLMPAHVLALASAFASRGAKSIVVPSHAGQRGNPVALDWPSVEATLAGQQSFSCRQFIDQNPDRVLRWEAPQACVRDIDTPGDLT